MPGVPTIWMIVGQGLIALAVGAGGGCLDISTLLYLFSAHSPSLWETVQYRLKDCLKSSLNSKQSTKLALCIGLEEKDWLVVLLFYVQGKHLRYVGTVS